MRVGGNQHRVAFFIKSGSFQVRNPAPDSPIARALQQMVYAGDPEDAGVVWPKVAEISLLGGIGCGRFLAELVLEELSCSSSRSRLSSSASRSSSSASTRLEGFPRCQHQHYEA